MSQLPGVLSEVLLEPILDAVETIDWEEVLKQVGKSDAQNLQKKVNEIKSSVMKIKDIGRNKSNLHLLKGYTGEDKISKNNKVTKIINNGIEKYLDLPAGTVDFTKKLIENGIDENNSMNLWEEIQGFVYEQIPGRLYSTSSQLLRDAMHNFSEAKKNKNATVEKGIQSLNKNIQNEIKKLGGSDNSMGVIYNENSEISKLFSNSPNLKEFVKNSNNLDNIINNKYSEGIPFEFGEKNLLLINEYDRYSSLQHSKVINPKIEDGYMTGTLVDYYDFSKRPNTLQNLPNNWGYDQQQKGILKNYYICVKIKVKI